MFSPSVHPVAKLRRFTVEFWLIFWLPDPGKKLTIANPQAHGGRIIVKELAVCLVHGKHSKNMLGIILNFLSEHKVYYNKFIQNYSR